MKVFNKIKLEKLKRKNKGNIKLVRSIDKLIFDLENANWKTPLEIKKDRSDADNVHSDGFYFFDINVHRTMILIVFSNNEAIIIWTGTHSEYDSTFKGNKKTIEKWLRKQELI